jgi:hypothetical protein
MQEQHKDTSYAIYDDAHPHREPAVEDKKCTAKQRGDHPASEIDAYRLGFALAIMRPRYAHS